MAVYHLKQKECEDAIINTKGFCNSSYWHGMSCYCKKKLVPVNPKYEGILMCPYAHRTGHDSDIPEELVV